MQVIMTTTIYQTAAIRRQFIDGITSCLETLSVDDTLLDEDKIGEYNADTYGFLSCFYLVLCHLFFR